VRGRKLLPLHQPLNTLLLLGVAVEALTVLTFPVAAVLAVY
jgi:hypothetical protein